MVPEEGFKSIGHETTFERDTRDRELLERTLLDLCEKVACRLRQHSARAHTIAVKFRLADFSTFTRRMTLKQSVNTAEKIFPIARRLMSTLLREDSLVRLIGVRAGNIELENEKKQLALFEESVERDRKLASALDDISRRFGVRAITRASLIKQAKRKDF